MKINFIIILIISYLMVVSCKDQKAAPVLMKKDSTQKKSFTSLSKEQLMIFLPSSNGLTKKGKPSGETAHYGTSGTAYYSFAKQEYTRGENNYYVEIIDYKDNPALLKGLLHMYGFDTLINNQEFATKQENLQIPGGKVISTIYKNDPQAKLTIAINERFLINAGVYGNKDVNPLIKLVSNMDFEQLYRLTQSPSPDKIEGKK